MTLLYWREYQTYFHLGKSFDISEANCYIVILSKLKIF
ncbi:transposase family protein [Spiroplasma poulsonii]